MKIFLHCHRKTIVWTHWTAFDVWTQWSENINTGTEIKNRDFSIHIHLSIFLDGIMMTMELWYTDKLWQSEKFQKTKHLTTDS